MYYILLTCTEYIISLLEILDDVNNMEEILPYHRLCFRSAIADPIPNLSTITSTIYQQCIEQDDLAVIINVSWGEIASFIHEVLLPYSLPVVSFSLPGSYHSMPVDTVLDVFQDKVRKTQGIEEKYLFTVAPSGSMVLKTLNALADFYQWRKIGLIFEDRGLIESNHFVQFRSKNRKTRCLFLVTLDYILQYKQFK